MAPAAHLDACLLVRCADALIGIPAESVREIMRMPALRPLPSPVRAMLGAAMIRGSAVAVLDLRRLLDLDDGVAPSRLVSLRVGVRRIALATDSVVGMARLDATLAAAQPLVSEAVRRLTVQDEALVLILETLRTVPEAAWQPLEST